MPHPNWYPKKLRKKRYFKVRYVGEADTKGFTPNKVYVAKGEHALFELKNDVGEKWRILPGSDWRLAK